MKQPIIKPAARTAVTTYDRISSWLTALIMVIGMVVIVFFLIWMSATESFRSSSRAKFMDVGESSNPRPVNNFWYDPQNKDFPELSSAVYESELTAVTDAASRSAGGFQPFSGRGTWGGDEREEGPPDPPGDEPPFKRWSIEHEAANAAEYFEMLEHFDVTLGAVSQATNQIEYLDDLTEASTYSTGRRADESRMYFHTRNRRFLSWQTNKWLEADVDLDRKILVQFYDESALEALYRCETETIELDGKTSEDVRHVTFGVESNLDGYEFVVLRIRYDGD